jgi:hypothetical protein
MKYVWDSETLIDLILVGASDLLAFYYSFVLI